ncbi:hypothetical protein HPB47_008475 [Ixodes persulcatus]|uniref:Uncharacterized protein n=1 Tax=Ixodes persulcatus TaxID=34615 RepID=A0AC60P4W8_IXOPE|nr:hypothetical protein HPB47_008475 [Ixodes persulcatus]
MKRNALNSALKSRFTREVESGSVQDSLAVSRGSCEMNRHSQARRLAYHPPVHAASRYACSAVPEEMDGTRSFARVEHETARALASTAVCLLRTKEVATRQRYSMCTPAAAPRTRTSDWGGLEAQRDEEQAALIPGLESPQSPVQQQQHLVADLDYENKKYRKKACCLLTLAVICIAALALVIYFSAR